MKKNYLMIGLKFDHMNELILDQGEACLALEIEK